jgi:hypothetical protein
MPAFCTSSPSPSSSGLPGLPTLTKRGASGTEESRSGSVPKTNNSWKSEAPSLSVSASSGLVRCTSTSSPSSSRSSSLSLSSGRVPRSASRKSDKPSPSESLSASLNSGSNPYCNSCKLVRPSPSGSPDAPSSPAALRGSKPLRTSHALLNPSLSSSPSGRKEDMPTAAAMRKVRLANSSSVFVASSRSSPVLTAVGLGAAVFAPDPGLT